MSLPARPNLEYLRKLAKDRLEDLQRADASAQLADAQLAVAREHGFSSWRKLRAHLDSLRPPAVGAGRTDWPPELIQEFFGAIHERDEAAVRRMLANAPELVNARHPGGSTPLSDAAEIDHPGLVELLLEHGADPGLAYAHSAHTPLSWALTVNSFDAARALVRGGVEPDLFCAAGLGDVDAVRSFFEPDGRLEPDASRTGSSRYSPDGTRLPCPPQSPREVVADALYMACRNGQDAVVEVLLEHQPDLSFRAFMGGTALHWAYFGGSQAAVAMLLRAGADPTARDDILRCTPRAFALCAPANWGWTTRVRRRLAEDPSLVNVMDGRGAPLHEAAREGHLEIVKLLVDAGADLGLRTTEGKTALDLARARPDHAGCASVAAWLEERSRL